MMSGAGVVIRSSSGGLEGTAVVRREARAVLLVELFETAPHGRRAGLFREVEGATAEGGEAGAEDHAGIEQVGVGHHPFAQARHRLIEVTKHQAIGDIRRRAIALVRFHQHGLVTLIAVKALAALLAETARRDEVAQALRHGAATERQMSRPTVSASRMGPIGMPKSVAAWSITTAGTPSDSSATASSR